MNSRTTMRFSLGPVLCFLTALSAQAAPPDPSASIPVTVVNEAAMPVPVSLTDSVDDHVMLRVRQDSDNVCGGSIHHIAHRAFPDRSVDDDPYRVPSGKKLVIDNVNWVAWTNVGWTAGEFLAIWVGVPSGHLFTTGTLITSGVAEAGYFAGSDNVSGGIVFHDDEPICVVGFSFQGGTGSDASSVLLGLSVLRGRLVDQD